MKPFEIGQRVRIYEYGRKHKGTIHSVGAVYVTVTGDEDGACRPYYPEQLRRLRPKVEGRAKEEKRVERWVNVYGADAVSLTAYRSIQEARNHSTGQCRIAHLLEVNSGEVIVDRAKEEGPYTLSNAITKTDAKLREAMNLLNEARWNLSNFPEKP